ncbi:hypothetical protein ACFLYY_01945 [Patescibacteria group bacterium]
MSYFQKTFIVIFGTIFLSVPMFNIFAVTGNTNVNLQIVDICDNDGACEPGEDELGCPNDCGCNNNGICEAVRGENNSNCPLDCPALPPLPPPPGGYAVDSKPPVIYNLLISKITLNSTEISWETDEPAFCKFFWGQTEEYKKEIILEHSLFLKHKEELKNLFPGTNYYFKISCMDIYRNEAETKGQQFTTLFKPDIVPPSNVLNFTATPGDEKITLSWGNPPDVDFKGVKIIRSTDFYPQDPFDGMSVYNGTGESFIDTELNNGTRYYYTAFTYDKSGNYSSGAIVSGVPNKSGVIEPPEEFPPSEIITPEIEKITFEDFDFFQGEDKIFITDEKINIKLEIPLTASIAYEKVPEVLKTIMVTLEDLDKKTFSFLLRINKEKTRYEAMIYPPEAGEYPLSLTILDYKNQKLKQINGYLVIRGEKTSGSLSWYKKTINWFYIFIALIIFATALYVLRKRNNKFLNKIIPNRNLTIH